MKNIYHNREEDKNWETMSIEELCEELNKILTCEVEVSDDTVINDIISLIFKRKLSVKNKELKLSSNDMRGDIYHLFKAIEGETSISEIQDEAISLYKCYAEAKRVCQEIMERNKELLILPQTDEEKSYSVLEFVSDPVSGVMVRQLGVTWKENEKEAIESVLKSRKDRVSTRDDIPTGYVTAVMVPCKSEY